MQSEIPICRGRVSRPFRCHCEDGFLDFAANAAPLEMTYTILTVGVDDHIDPKTILSSMGKIVSMLLFLNKITPSRCDFISGRRGRRPLHGANDNLKLLDKLEFYVTFNIKKK